MGKKAKLCLIISASVIAIIAIACGIYLGIYYHADESAKDALNTSDTVTVSKVGDNFVFAPENPTKGLIFYPGGKVEYTAYAPLMKKFAEKGFLCVLVKMPANLAVFNPSAADGLTDLYPQIDRWFIGGHSLGGSMAATYLGDHTSEFEGLILLASYSTEDLSGTNIDTYSIYGSNDGVMQRDKYDKYRSNLSNVHELVIDGGNHAGFGAYGEQSGDGAATISQDEQITMTVDFIDLFTNRDMRKRTH